MSTTTTFKRLALVTVAALGFGVLSVAPSSATVINLATAVVDGTATTAVSDSTTAATMRVTFTGTASTDSVTVTSYVSSRPTGADALAASEIVVRLVDTATSSVETTVKPAGGSALTITGTSVVRGDSTTVVVGTSTTGTNSAKLGYNFLTPGDLSAGTYVITSVLTPYSSGVAGTPTTKDVSIVVSALASESETPSAAYSNAYLAGGSTASAADSATISAAASATTTIANLNVLVRNASNGTQAIDTLTVTITGPGLFVSGTTKYKKLVESGDVNLAITGDGTAGTSTITVKYEVTGQTITKTMAFYATAAKTITTSVRTPVLKVGDNAGAVGVTAVDANGNPWTGTAYIVASSAADALIAGSTTPVACAAWTATSGILCDVAGVSAGTAKFKVIDASTVAAATASSEEFSVKVSTAPAATVKVEFDKATYAPYEKAIITVSVLDASGASVPADTFANLFATGGISANQSFTGSSDTLTAVSITTATASSAATGAIALKAFYTVYMPAQGDLILTWTGGTSLPLSGQVAGTVKAAISNAGVDAATDAAQEATDAANAATDAALQAADDAAAASAAVAKLSKSVNKALKALKKQITALTALVNKLL